MDLKFETGDLCAEVVLSDVDQTQFESRKEVLLSAASIKSVQSTAADVRSVKNANGIVVGKWIDDGFIWSVSTNYSTSPIRACVYVQAPQQAPDEIKYALFDVVEASVDFSTFTPRGLNVPITNKGVVCIGLTQRGVPLFPVAYVHSYQALFISPYPHLL